MATLNGEQLNRIGELFNKINQALKDTGLEVGPYSGHLELIDGGECVGFLGALDDNQTFIYESDV